MRSQGARGGRRSVRLVQFALVWSTRLLLPVGFGVHPTQDESAWTTHAVRSTAHRVESDRGLTAIRLGWRGRGCYREERAGQPSAEHLPIDHQTFNRCQRCSVKPPGLAPHFRTGLLKYPTCRPFETSSGTTKTERSFPRPSDVHQGQGLSTWKCEHDQEWPCLADHRSPSSAFFNASPRCPLHRASRRAAPTPCGSRVWARYHLPNRACRLSNATP